MRVLAACSLGGAGHLQPLVPFLDEARRSGHETLVVCPPAMAGMVDETGHPFQMGGEPPEHAVGPIREQLAIVPAGEASVLGNRELFGRLATTAMLPSMDAVLQDWQPDVVLRDPCEYASAVAAAPLGIPTVTVAIGLAEVEWASIDIAAPALEVHRAGFVQELRRSPYVTRFPATVDPSPFPDTRRFSQSLPTPQGALGDWWPGSSAPLVYMSFGTVLGHMTIASEIYRTALEAVTGLDARVLLTVGRRFDPSQLNDVPDNVHVEAWVDQADALERGCTGRLPWRIGDHLRRPRSWCPGGRRSALRRPVHQRIPRAPSRCWPSDRGRPRYTRAAAPWQWRGWPHPRRRRSSARRRLLPRRFPSNRGRDGGSTHDQDDP